MAKHRVGVLEASASPDSTAPAIFCGRTVADWLIEKQMARKLGKSLVQMLQGAALEAIELARAALERARQEAFKLWERQQLRLGVGNILPYSLPTDPGRHFHYEIPHAGDTGIRRWGFRERASEKNEQLKTRAPIKVSARPRQSTSMPATAAPTFATRLADAFSG
jgi:hypothetical protein